MKRNVMFKILLMIVVGLFLSLDAFAQQMTVKGIVKDTTGEPIIGANVVVKGSSNGTITDFEGNFQFNANKGDIIVISFIGYQAQEVPAAANLNIILKDDTQLLQDVVVIGYGTVKKNDATGSVTAIKPDQLSKGITTNAQDMLSGKVAGVSVISNDGAPGSGAQIRIRGGSSLNASNDPLLVIDGLAIDNQGIKGMSNGLSMVNPEDIETFTVLKDASATAIYGSRASNGVIIITTKKGKNGQAPKINYNGSISLATTQKRYDVLDGNEYRAYAQQLWGDKYPAEMDTANTDWQDQIFRTAVSTDHHISITGGLKNVPYRVSVGYTNENGIIKTSNFQRLTASVNLAPSFFDDHLKFNINAKYMYGKNRYADAGAAVGGALSIAPTHPVYGTGDAFKFSGGYWQNMQATDGFSDKDWTYTTDKNTPQNPLAALEQRNKKANSNDFVGNVEVDYKVHFLPDLRLHASIGGEYADGNEREIVSPYSYTNNYYGWNGLSTQYKYNISYNAYAQYIKSLGAHDFDIMVGGEEQHFHRNGADGVGQGWDSYKNEPVDQALRSQKAYATRNTLVSFFGRLNYSLLNRYLFTFTMRWDGSSRFSSDNRWGTFPSLALGWKMKEENFLKNVNFLSDLKLRLGWGITGQQDIGDDFAFLPLYVTSDDYAQYPFGDTYYSSSRPKAFNTDLKWEKTTTWNGGLDFGFLDNRVFGSLDLYYNTTKDLLMLTPISDITGFSFTYDNVGSTSNRGIEVLLGGDIIKTNDFNLTASLNVNINRGRVEELAEGIDGLYKTEWGSTMTRPNTGDYILEEGQPVGMVRGYTYEGWYTTSDFNYDPVTGIYTLKDGVPDIAAGVIGTVYGTENNKPGSQTAYPGVIKYADISGPDGVPDGVVDESDVVIIGNMNPKHTGGLNLNASYKSFDLGLFFNWSYGNQIYNANYLATIYGSKNDGLYRNRMDYLAGAYKIYDIKNGNLVKVTDPAALDALNTDASLFLPYHENAVVSTLGIEDGSFLRLNSLTLGYTFPGKTIRGLGMSNLRLYVTGYNLWLLTNYSGYDPEVSTTRNSSYAALTPGIDYSAYPRSRSVTFGVNVTF